MLKVGIDNLRKGKKKTSHYFWALHGLYLAVGPPALLVARFSVRNHSQIPHFLILWCSSHLRAKLLSTDVISRGGEDSDYSQELLLHQVIFQFVLYCLQNSFQVSYS